MLLECNELQTVEDDLYAHLKKLLASGEIKSTDSKLLLELAERRSSRVPEGPPIAGLLKKLPFGFEPPLAK